MCPPGDRTGRVATMRRRRAPKRFGQRPADGRVALRLQDLVPADPESGGQLRRRGRAVQQLGQLVAGHDQPRTQFLYSPGRADVPPAVAEVPLELAEDGGARVAGEWGTPRAAS